MEARMKRFRSLWQRAFQTASLARTVLETLLLGFALTLLSLLAYGTMADTLYAMALLFFISPCCGLWYALRLRPATGSKKRQFADELLCLLLTGVVICAVSLLLVFDMNEGKVDEANFGVAVVFVCGTLIFPFAFFRVFSRLWIGWKRLRERRLIWSLMNSHLIAVALLQAIIIVPAMILLMNSSDLNWTSLYVPENSVSQWFYRLNMALPLLGLAILASLVVLIALLPASAVVSYFLSRRIKQRLDVLMQAAQTARDGDYHSRIQVSGSDEISRLQTDFNAMIASLESHLASLDHEREKVTALLVLRREMMANVSHELRTPIATIRAYLDTAQDDEIAALGTDVVTILEREILTLQNLIDDLFALSRVEVDQLTLHIQPVSLPDLVNHVVEIVAPLAWRSNRVEVSTQVPLWIAPVQADAHRLEQVLRNLLHNSLRHTLPGGVVIVSARQKEGFVEIDVRDTGEGISPEDLPHVWERFYRGDGGGSGLGLTLVKSLVETMGGQVAVESVVGEGSCFTISLPLSGGIAIQEDLLPKPQPVLHSANLR
jgi:signal transduction histidine kinase